MNLSKKSNPDGSAPFDESDYYWPGIGHALKNKLDLDNPTELDWAENVITKSRYAKSAYAIMQIDSHKINRLYQPQFYRKSHRDLFQDIYIWAGTYRIEEMEIPGRPTAKMHDIKQIVKNTLNMARLELEKTDSINKTAKSIAKACNQLNRAHPFRNGNGRTLMLYAAALASAADCNLFLSYDDLRAFNKARTDGLRNDMTTYEKLFAERLFHKSDQSELHQELKQEAKRLAETAPPIESLIEKAKQPKRNLLEIVEFDKQRRSSTKPTKSTFAKIIDKSPRSCEDLDRAFAEIQQSQTTQNTEYNI